MPCVSGKYPGGGVVKKLPGSRKPWKNMSSAGEKSSSTRCTVFRDKVKAPRWQSQ